MPIPILHDLANALLLDYFCVNCGELMNVGRTEAGEKVLRCPGCKHAVAWSTRFESCKVSEWKPVIRDLLGIGGSK